MQASPAFVEAFSKCLTLISTNDTPQCDATLRPFFASTAPNISMTDYLQRILQYAPVNDELLVVSMVYIDKMVSRSFGRLAVGPLNVHRLFLTGLLVSIKFYSDTFYSNSYFASVGGVSTSEMNALERLMLKTLAFDLTVKPEEFHFVFSEILDGEHLRLPLVFPKTSNSARLWTLEQVEADLAAQNGLRFSRPTGTTAVAVEQPQHHKEKVSHQRNSTKASSQELITGHHGWMSKRKDVSEIETHRAGGAVDAEKRHIVAHKTDHLLSRHAHSRPGKQADNGDELERESSESIDHAGVEEMRGGAGDNPSLARQVTRRRAGGNPSSQSANTKTASARYAHATEGSSFGSPEEECDLSRSVHEVSTPRGSSYQESSNQREEAAPSPGMGWASDASASSSSSSSPISGEGVFVPPKFASLFCPTLPNVNPVTPISGFWTNVDSPRAASYHMGVGKGRRSTSNSYEAFRPSESPKPNFGRPSPALSMTRRNGPARHHHHSTLQSKHTYQGQIQSRSTSTTRREPHPTTTTSCTSPTASSSTHSTMAPYSPLSPSNVIFRSAPRNEDAAYQPRQEDGATSFRAHNAAAAASVVSHDDTVTDLAMLAFQSSSGSPSACVLDSQYRLTCSLCQAAALCSSASVSGYGNGSSAPSPASHHHLLPHQHAHNHHQQQQQSGGLTCAPMGLPPFSPRLLDCPIRTAQSPTDISDMESSEEEEFAYTGLSRSLSHPNIKFHSSSPVASLGSPGYFHYDEEDEDRDILSDEQVEVEEDVMRRTIDHPTSSRELGDDSPFQSPATPSGVASHSWAPRNFFMSPSAIHSPNMSSSGQHPCSLQAGQNLAARPEDYDPQTQPQSPTFDRPATQTPREDSLMSSTGSRSRSRRPSANTNSLAVSASSVAVDLLSSSDNVSQCSNTDSDNEIDDDANVDADVDQIDDCREVNNDDELSFQGDPDFEDPTTERSSRLVSSHYHDTSDIFAALRQSDTNSAMLTTPSRTVSLRTNPRGGNSVPSSGRSSWSRAWNSRALSHRDRFSEPEPRRTTIVEMEDVFSGVSSCQSADESSLGHTAVFVSTPTFGSFTSPRRHLSLGYDNFYTPRSSNMAIEALQKPAREEACSVPITLSTN